MPKDSEMTDEEFNAEIVREITGIAARINVRKGILSRLARGEEKDYAAMGRKSAAKRWGTPIQEKDAEIDEE